jgi:hypothetical protein
MRHDSYLPSSPATLQALDRMEYAMVNAIAPPDVRIVGPHFNVSSHSLSVIIIACLRQVVAFASLI